MIAYFLFSVFHLLGRGRIILVSTFVSCICLFQSEFFVVRWRGGSIFFFCICVLLLFTLMVMTHAMSFFDLSCRINYCEHFKAFSLVWESLWNLLLIDNWSFWLKARKSLNDVKTSKLVSINSGYIFSTIFLDVSASLSFARKAYYKAGFMFMLHRRSFMFYYKATGVERHIRFSHITVELTSLV